MTGRTMPRTHACADCPTLVTKRAIRCKPCHGRYAGSSPDFARVRRAEIKARYNQPAFLARQSTVMRGVTARRVAAMLGWCPPDRLDEYKRLTRVRTNGRRMTAAEAKRAIIASLSPFERQERALLRGAGLVANVRVAK